MSKRTVQLAAYFLALVFFAFALPGCATIERGANVVASLFKGDQGDSDQQDNKDKGNGGLLANLAKTPEPTPASLKDRFKNELKTVLDDAVKQADRFGSMQLALLFDPDAKADDSQSSRTAFSVKMIPQAEEDKDETLTISVETVNDTENGEASFVMSAGSGEEQLGTGGVYFVGSDMLVKRGDTSKKLICYPLKPEQAESFKGLSAIERMTRVFGGDENARTSTADWDKDIDDTLGVFDEQTKDADYTEGTEQLTLLGAQYDSPSVTMNAKGEPAKVILDKLLTLMEKDSALGTLSNSSSKGEGEGDEEESSLKSLQTELDSLTAEELAAVELSIATASYEDQPVFMKLSATVKGKTTKLTAVNYEKGLERQTTFLMENGDGDLLSMDYSNANTGGDNYKGRVFLSMTEDGEKKMELTSDSTGTNDGSNITRKSDFTVTSYGEEDGKKTTQTMSGNIDWTQQKGVDGAVTASGTGAMNFPINDSDTKINLEITLEQSFSDVKVEAPQFLESAGVVADAQDQLFTELGIDKEEYKKMPFMEAALSAMFVLLQ